MKENNYCVIMAGGVGSRFWPFSRNENQSSFLISLALVEVCYK